MVRRGPPLAWAVESGLHGDLARQIPDEPGEFSSDGGADLVLMQTACATGCGRHSATWSRSAVVTRSIRSWASLTAVRYSTKAMFCAGWANRTVARKRSCAAVQELLPV